jgi:hypothetical protein
MTMHSKTIFVLGCCIAALFAGCGPSFTATTPPGFVELDDDHDDYDYRATTADGLVTSVREIEHDPEGSPEFWLKAIKNRMRERGGYALLDEVKVTSADGVQGTQLRFGHDEESGQPHLYYVTLFVTESKLFLLEAGGTKELMTQGKAQLAAAVSGFSTH